MSHLYTSYVACCPPIDMHGLLTAQWPQGSKVRGEDVRPLTAAELTQCDFYILWPKQVPRSAQGQRGAKIDPFPTARNSKVTL